MARALGLKGIVENLDDGRVRKVAEGEDDRLKWFEEAIVIKNTLIQVSSIEKGYSACRGDFAKFYRASEPGETDSRLDKAAVHLGELIVVVNKMNDNLGGKMDMMIHLQHETLDLQKETLNLQHETLDLQKETLNNQEDLLDEVRESRKDLKGYLDPRFEKLEGDVTEIRIALKAKGII